MTEMVRLGLVAQLLRLAYLRREKLMRIHGLEGLTDEQIERELGRGGKFVIFEWCVSIVVMTFKQPTDIYFVRAGESTFGRSFGFSLVSLLLGWWGFPWGPIYTVASLVTNLGGGKDVTNEVLQAVAGQPAA